MSVSSVVVQPATKKLAEVDEDAVRFVAVAVPAPGTASFEPITVTMPELSGLVMMILEEGAVVSPQEIKRNKTRIER